MSAWLCTPKEIAIIAVELVRRLNATMIGVNPEELAKDMARLNLRSLAWRYKDLTPARAAKEFGGTTAKGFVEKCVEATKREEVVNNDLLDGRLWGLVACYLYQACECDDYATDLTWRTVGMFQQVLEADCTKRGLERVGWSLWADEIREKQPAG